MLKKSNSLRQKILNITQQCVRCAMCSPHCPTNKLTNLEGQSPRGRIALWQSLANDRLTPTDKTINYLDHCLNCGACEKNCPAGVQFLELQDLGKNFLQTELSLPSKLFNDIYNKIILRIFATRVITISLNYLLKFYTTLKLHKLTKIILKPSPNLFNNLDRLYQLFNATHCLNNSSNLVENQPTPTLYKLPINLQSNQNIIIFTGCVNRLSANNKINATFELLQKLGLKPHIAHQLHCCGALYKHNGYQKKYLKIVESNIKNLKRIIQKIHQQNHYPIKILSLDTGCHRDLLEQFNVVDNIEIFNIEQFLYNFLTQTSSASSSLFTTLDAIKRSRIKLNPDKVFVYTPCSQEYLGQTTLVLNLLSLILPKSNIVSISRGYGCCGAAGNYMLKNPNISEKLGNQIIQDFFRQNPELLGYSKANAKITIITTNIGCKLHLTQLIKNKYRLSFDIISPAELINSYF